MKLTVRVADGVAPGGKIALICDEEGNPLPNQRETRLTCKYNDVAIISVDFIIDGNKIALVEGS